MEVRENGEEKMQFKRRREKGGVGEVEEREKEDKEMTEGRREMRKGLWRGRREMKKTRGKDEMKGSLKSDVRRVERQKIGAEEAVEGREAGRKAKRCYGKRWRGRREAARVVERERGWKRCWEVFTGKCGRGRRELVGK